MADIEIEIDGQKLTAKPNQTVIQVADDAGIYIPRFCYHKHMSIPANCRMCLVEVEKAPKVLPACATPVAPGMKVFTKSQKTLLAQRAVMEFLLINHPLDCPICDQGGECELQDLSMGYGSPESKYDESKRAVPDQNLGPLISTEMTRCIYCTRCVRFGDEIAGIRELGAIGRGEFTEIGTYIQHSIKSELSGNIIDLCPVGALTSKPFRFTARPWELDQAPSVSPHDCIGTNVNVHTRYGTVMRIVSRENLNINHTWIADRDRFSYTALYHPDRIAKPQGRINGEWQTVEWQQALTMATMGLKKVIDEHSASQLGGLASPNSTTEEFYLFQKLIRSLGSPNVDHRLRDMDMRDQTEMPLFPGLKISIPELAGCDAILLVGSNIQKEQPIAGGQIRQAFLKGATVLAVNPIDYHFNFNLAGKKIVAPHLMINALADILSALEKESKDAAINTIANHLRDKKNICILFGALAMHHKEASVLRALTQKIAEKTSAKIGFMTDGANSAGAWLAGCIPHRFTGGSNNDLAGLNAYEMFASPLKSYLLMNVEPELDCANATLAKNALEQAKFVVALSLYKNPLLEAHADIILPLAPFTETSGTFVNVTGDWQSFKGVAKNFAESRPGWKILRVLANFLGCEGFDFKSSDQVRDEIETMIKKATNHAENKGKFVSPIPTVITGKHLSRIGEIPIYAGDSIVRRAKPLQEAQSIMEGNPATIRLHPETAKKLGLQDNQVARIKQQSDTVPKLLRGDAVLPVVLDTRIPEEAVWIAGGIKETTNLGDLFGEVEVGPQ